MPTYSTTIQGDATAPAAPVTVANATLAVTQSGTWTVSLAAGSIDIGKVDQGLPGTLANAWPVELSDGTNLLGVTAHPVRTDPTGTTTQPVSLTSTTITGSVAVTGTFFQATQPVSLTSTTITGTVAVTQSTSPWVVSGTVTSNIGTTNGLALDASVTGLQVAQGSTTSGQKGGLTLGAVTTAAPAYTTAQSSPLSLTTTGLLRVDGSGVTQPVSGTVTANQGGAPWSQNITQIAGSAIATAATGIAKVGLTDGSGNAITSTSNAIDDNLKSWMGSTAPTIGQKTMANSLPMVIASDQSSLKTPLDILATGTAGALNAAVTATTNGTGSAIFQVTGVFVATLVAEGSADNSNWTNLTIFPASGASTTAGITTTGSYRIPSVGAYTNVRIRASAYTSGTATITLNVSQAVAAPQLFSPNAINVKVDALSSKEAQSSVNQTFVTVVSAFNLTPANADDVVLYIKNGSGSGKTIVLQQVQLMTASTSGGTSAAIILAKMFANPTSSANGTAATISTTSVGSAATSAMTAFTGPTVSANGTLLYAAAGGNNQYTIPLDVTGYRVAPNNNILFTINTGTNNTTVNLVVLWSEE